MTKSVDERVHKRLAPLREAGFRPVQIWVADARRPGFSEECRRQGQVAAKADLADPDLLKVMDAALADTNERTT